MLCTVLVLTACGGSKNSPDRINATYAELPPPEPSSVTIPVKIAVDELEKLLDQQLEHSNLSGGSAGAGEDRRLNVKVKKAGNIELTVLNQEMRYKVPLDLDVTYDLALGEAKADAVLALSFKSKFAIDSTWHLSTETELVAYDWIREPKLRLGVISLPISSISNYVIRRSEAAIGQGIDQAIRDQVALENYVTDAWNLLQQPILLSDEYQAWLQLHPTDLRMTPLQTSENSLQATIRLDAVPRLTFSAEAPSSLPAPFPAFAYDYRPAPENEFQLRLSSLITYAEAERLASQSVVGETYSSGNKSVRVDSLKLFGNAGKLIVELSASGAYNGSIYLSGVPTFDARQNRLEIKQLDFTLNTRSFLTKTAAWLLKGKLKRQIQQNLNAIITENLNELRSQIETQLANQELAPGISLNGELNQLGLSQTLLTEAGIELVVGLDGNLGLSIDGLTQLLSDE